MLKNGRYESAGLISVSDLDDILCHFLLSHLIPSHCLEGIPLLLFLISKILGVWI